MANQNMPFGLRPIGRQIDATPSFGLGADPLKIASNNTTVIAKGDILVRLGTGYVTALTAAANTDPTNATGISNLIGIFQGCQYLSISQGKRVVSEYWPGADASGDVDVLYIPFRPGMRLVAQTNGAVLTSGLVFADIGQNINIAYSAPTVVGTRARSNVTLSAMGTTVGLPFIITALWSQIAPNSPGAEAGIYNWGVVEFNGGSLITGIA